jgi:hypothetical protein
MVTLSSLLIYRSSSCVRFRQTKRPDALRTGGKRYIIGGVGIFEEGHEIIGKAKDVTARGSSRMTESSIIL